MNSERPAAGDSHTAGVLVVAPSLRPEDIDSRKNQFSPGVSSFLEMYGFVDHDIVATEDMARRLRQSRPTFVIVLNHPDWSPIMAALDLLRERAAGLLIEGPVCPETAAALSLSIGERAASMELDVADSDLRQSLQEILRGYARADAVRIDPIVSAVGRIVTDGSGAKTVVEEPVESRFHDEVQRLQTFAGADEAILEIDGEGVLVRAGAALVSGFPIVNLICQRLGAADMAHPWRRAVGERNGENLDYIVLLSMARLAREAGRPLVSIDPWPEGVANALTLRLDVDRPVSDADWRRLLDWQARKGVKPTWYYLAKTIDPARIRQTTALGHETALHYTNLETRGRNELEALQAAVESAGGHVKGMSCHGGNFHGAGDIDWAEKAGLSYAEMLTRCALFPFRPVMLRGPAQTAISSPVWAAARHLSVDRKMSPPEADFSYGERTCGARRATQSHIVIMNHPDINFEALAAALDFYDGPGVEYWTQGQAIDWMRASRAKGAVDIRRRDDGTSCEITVRHSAPRDPVLRVWADVEAADALDKPGDLGETHTRFRAENARPLRIQRPSS